MSFSFLTQAGLAIATFISDRHRGIAKWIRTAQQNTKHFFDLWHVSRSLGKKLLKASLEKNCEIIKDWMKGINDHLYWSVTSTKQGFGDMIVAKWKSFMRHVSNKHKEHGNDLFKECAHGTLEPRKWVKLGMYKKSAR